MISLQGQLPRITRLTFQEFETINHHIKDVFPILGYRHHGYNAALKTILKQECGALFSFDIEGDILQSAFVEEVLVLD